jgi:hypothetical protein
VPAAGAILKVVNVAAQVVGAARSRGGKKALLFLGTTALGFVAAVAVVLVAVLTAVQGSVQAAECGTGGSPGGSSTYVSQEPSEEALADIPSNYLDAYREAGEEHGIDWAILAGIGSVESDHGRIEGGCIEGPATAYGTAKGPMQFIDSTWASYGVDGNGDGQRNPCDFEDAIPAAASYLVASGAPEDYYGAVYAYNHADWYMQDVLARADGYRAAAGSGGGSGGGLAAGEKLGGYLAVANARLPIAGRGGFFAPLVQPEMLWRAAGLGTEDLSRRFVKNASGMLAMRPAYAQEETSEEGVGDAGAVFPLPEEYQDDFSNDWGAARGHGGHEGTDLFAPDGTPIYSITDGMVVPVSGADSQGWNTLGGWTTMIEASESVGPIRAGDTLYYAHQIEPSPVQPGQRVEAGQVIGHVGSTGEGPPGTLLQPASRGQHLHLGWYDPSGTRAEAATGAMNPYPLLEWLIESGGTASGEEAVPMQQGACREEPGEGDAGGGGGTAPGSGDPQALLGSPNFDGNPGVMSDLKTGEVDPRLVATLEAIVAEHRIFVSTVKSDHPMGPYVDGDYGSAGGAVNTHYFYRAADIAMVDGVSVAESQTSESTLDVGRILAGLPPESRPDEIVGPTDWTSTLGYSRDQGFVSDYSLTSRHENHIHAGFASEDGTSNVE